MLYKKKNDYIFRVSTHNTKYVLSELIPYYGENFCRRFETAWQRAAVFRREGTANTYFKDVRRLFLWLARRGISAPDSCEGRCYRAHRDDDAANLKEDDWSNFISNISCAILDQTDTSFIDGKSRDKKIENLRGGLRWLSGVLFVPKCYPQGRTGQPNSQQLPCLATIAHRAGRLPLNGMGLEEATERFIKSNVEILEELRRCFWADLKENIEKFDQGIAIQRDPTIPSIIDIDNALNDHLQSEVRPEELCEILNIDREAYFACAVRYSAALLQGHSPKTSIKRLSYFLSSAGGHQLIAPYIGPTIEGLTAAYMILMIDSGANSQPLNDLPANPVVGGRRRGRQSVATLAVSKNRAGGAPQKMHLLGEAVDLSTKSTPTRPSGLKVLNEWRRLSSTLRQTSGKTAERLWVWKIPGHSAVRTNVSQLSSKWLPRFRRRHISNPVFGGLNFTRPIIRKAVANSKGDTSDFAYEIVKALMGHNSTKMPFQYMTEGALRALLHSKIREFQNVWEATTTLNIEGAATKLGVPEEELTRRVQLGLSNGLEFSAIGADHQQECEPSSREAILHPGAELLVATETAMRKLEVARVALQTQFASSAHVNPERFIRTWLPWLATVQGYSEKLAASRFKVTFLKVQTQVEADLNSGCLRLPQLW